MASTSMKLQCLEREIKYRRRVYPRLIEADKMRPDVAAREIELMMEIADDYRRQHAAENPNLFTGTQNTRETTARQD